MQCPNTFHDVVILHLVISKFTNTANYGQAQLVGLVFFWPIIIDQRGNYWDQSETFMQFISALQFYKYYQQNNVTLDHDTAKSM